MTPNKRADRNTIGGAILVGIGLLLLLQNLELLRGSWDLIWSLAFIGVGGVFLAVLVRDPQRLWWAAIPGCVLCSIGALIGLNWLFPALKGRIGGSVFLGGLGAAFWATYFFRRDYFWAIIPGGVLVTLAAVALIDGVIPGVSAGGIFFLGLSGTFGLVYRLPGPAARTSWALIPAAVLLVLAMVVTIGSMGQWLFPLALIGAGAYLLIRTERSRRDR